MMYIAGQPVCRGARQRNAGAGGWCGNMVHGWPGAHHLGSSAEIPQACGARVEVAGGKPGKGHSLAGLPEGDGEGACSAGDGAAGAWLPCYCRTWEACTGRKSGVAARHWPRLPVSRSGNSPGTPPITVRAELWCGPRQSPPAAFRSTGIPDGRGHSMKFASCFLRRTSHGT